MSRDVMSVKLTVNFNGINHELEMPDVLPLTSDQICKAAEFLAEQLALVLEQSGKLPGTKFSEIMNTNLEGQL